MACSAGSVNLTYNPKTRTLCVVAPHSWTNLWVRLSPSGELTSVARLATEKHARVYRPPSVDAPIQAGGAVEFVWIGRNTRPCDIYFLSRGNPVSMGNWKRQSSGSTQLSAKCSGWVATYSSSSGSMEILCTQNGITHPLWAPLVMFPDQRNPTVSVLITGEKTIVGNIPSHAIVPASPPLLCHDDALPADLDIGNVCRAHCELCFSVNESGGRADVTGTSGDKDHEPHDGVHGHADHCSPFAHPVPVAVPEAAVRPHHDHDGAADACPRAIALAQVAAGLKALRSLRQWKRELQRLLDDDREERCRERCAKRARRGAD